MLRTSRLLLIGLLALMQMFAPLVHAHVGGGGSAVGFPHLPELEALSQVSLASIEIGAERGAPDFVVGMAPGLKSDTDRLAPGPDIPTEPRGGIDLDTTPAPMAPGACLAAADYRNPYATAAPRGPPQALLTH